MDLVGHFELPTAHLNPVTASVEDCEYAIKLGRHCMSSYMTIIEEMDNLRRGKMRLRLQSTM